MSIALAILYINCSSRIVFGEAIASGLMAHILKIKQEEWGDDAASLNLQKLAHEQIGRELFWNRECLVSRKQEDLPCYVKLIRTSAFDSLVSADAPLDDLFPTLVRFDSNQDVPQRFKSRLESVGRLSILIERLYNRLWMLRHRVNSDLAPGDLAYVRYLLMIAFEEVDFARDLLFEGKCVYNRRAEARSARQAIGW